MTNKLFFLRMLICVSISGGSIFTFTTSFADAADASDPSLILYFSFDELEGDMFTKVPDLSQYGNDGTLIGEPELVEGKYGMALQLDGQMDWVEVPHADSLTVDEAVTVMAWIHTERHGSNNAARWQGILAKGNNPRSYSFYTESRSQCLHLSVGGSGSVCDGIVKLNEWQHVVASVGQGVHRYWINGEHVGESSRRNPPPGDADLEDVLIGRTHEGNREFLGIIDEVRIWNRVLSEDEIREEMIFSMTISVSPRGKLATRWASLKRVSNGGKR